MKKELDDRQQQGESNTNKWNLSPETLEAYADNDRKVKAGLLPKYIGGNIDAPSNPEVERQAKRVIDFTHIIDQKRRSTR